MPDKEIGTLKLPTIFTERRRNSNKEVERSLSTLLLDHKLGMLKKVRYYLIMTVDDDV